MQYLKIEKKKKKHGYINNEIRNKTKQQIQSLHAS
jgi:hypothetical protein